MSVGLTLIFGVLGIVNFAQGSMLTLSMYIVYSLGQVLGLPVYAATLLAVPLMFALGFVIQLTLLNKLTMSGNHEGPLLVTLGLSLLIINVLLMVYSGRPKSVGSAVGGSVEILGALVSWERLIAFLGAVVVTVALTVILRRTSFGLSIRAVAVQPPRRRARRRQRRPRLRPDLRHRRRLRRCRRRPDGTAGQPDPDGG